MTNKIIDLFDQEILESDYEIDYHHNIKLKDLLINFNINSTDLVDLKDKQPDQFVFCYTFFLLKDLSSRKKQKFLKKINLLIKNPDFVNEEEYKQDCIFIIKVLICASTINKFYNKILSSVFNPFDSTNYDIKRILKKIIPKMKSIDTKEDSLSILNFIESLLDSVIKIEPCNSRLSVLRILQPTLGSVLVYLKKHIKNDNELKLEKLKLATNSPHSPKKMILCKLYDEVFNFYEDFSFIEQNTESFLDFSFYYLSINDKTLNLQIENSIKLIDLRKNLFKIFNLQYNKLLKTNLNINNQKSLIYFLKHIFREYSEFKKILNTDVFREWVISNIFKNSNFNINHFIIENNNLRYLNPLFLFFTKKDSLYNQECLKFFNINLKYFNETIKYFKSNNYQIIFKNLISLYQSTESEFKKTELLETIFDFISNSNLEIKHIKSFEPYILAILNNKELSNPLIKTIIQKHFEKLSNLFLGIQNPELLTKLFNFFNDLDNFEKKTFLNSCLLINQNLSKEIYDHIIKCEKYNSMTILLILKQESFIDANYEILFSKNITINYYHHIQSLLKLNCFSTYDLSNHDLITVNKNFLYASYLKSEVIREIFNDYYPFLKENSFIIRHLGSLIAGHKNTPNEILLTLSSLYPKIVQKNKSYKGSAKAILTYFDN